MANIISRNSNNIDILINNIDKLYIASNGNKYEDNYEIYYLEDKGTNVPHQVIYDINKIFIKLPENIQKEQYGNELESMFSSLYIKEKGECEDYNYTRVINLYNKNSKYLADIDQFKKIQNKVRGYYFRSVMEFLIKMTENISFDINDSSYNDIKTYEKDLILLLQVLIVNIITSINSNIESYTSYNSSDKEVLDILIAINNCFTCILFIICRC